ncbi:MAG: hypothetical protein NVSMB33_05600 [Ktedonobacteraceae bacterium]
MAYAGQQNEDIRATLALSQEEGRTGTSRTLNLPGGRQVVVPVPAGTRDGQEIRLEGQGQPSAYGGRSNGDLILTIAIAPAESYGFQNSPQAGIDLPTAFAVTPPPPPPAASTPSYLPHVQPGSFTNYSSHSQRATYPDAMQQPNAQQTAYAQTPQYSTPQLYSAPPPYMQSPSPQRRRGLSRGMTLLLIVLALLIIFGAGGLLLYTTVIQPEQLHAQATATAAANVTGTAQAQTTATSQVVATSQAHANATVTALAQANAQSSATATALQNVYTSATSGTPTLNDSMTHQDSNAWEEDNKTGGGSCAFTGGSYHATMPQVGFFASCYASTTNFSNFALQVQMNILKGDRGGIIFRSNSTATRFYLLRIDQSGSYDLYVYVDNNGSNARSLIQSSTTAIHTGLNQNNQIAVVARANNIYIYINQQYVNSISDSTYSSGSIAVFAEDHTQATDVVFTNVQVWKL